jgi:hypothetical protein
MSLYAIIKSFFAMQREQRVDEHVDPPKEELPKAFTAIHKPVEWKPLRPFRK